MHEIDPSSSRRATDSRTFHSRHLQNEPGRGCKKFRISPPPGEGKSVGEEYQFVKRGREYHTLGQEFTSKKGYGGAISIIKAVGKNIK